MAASVIRDAVTSSIAEITVSVSPRSDVSVASDVVIGSGPIQHFKCYYVYLFFIKAKLRIGKTEIVADRNRVILLFGGKRFYSIDKFRRWI